MRTLEQHEQATLVRQRDDAIDKVQALAPVAQAAIAFRALELGGHYQTTEWHGAGEHLRGLVDRYVEEHGTEVDA
ncbi:hypothetical protein ASE27_10295 [Oerskovia sp. Root918]|uniref:hypothetical protein n=1 Tax=Oerskovia sp. Root918 TaxID=1736607 RepID=UPI0006FB93BF|nr:hypothetical protein [Oerskovia sp. Root918]KRD36837.1 hypothetical protein ASE27_10295 [Oerskovia sp. Root918]